MLHIENEKARELKANPFISSFYFHIDFYEEIPKFGEAIEQLKENENYSKSKILFAMFEYARIYEQFRPISITQDDAYFGTVKKMDGIYLYLFNYLESDLSITFSKVAIPYIDKVSIEKKHSKIKWDMMIEDIKIIDKAILITMEEQAVKLYCILGDNSPYYIWNLVKGYILRFHSFYTDVTLNKEDIDLKEGAIFIKGEKIVCDDFYQLNNAITEFVKKRKQT
jgi:hypothetical protein